MPFDPRDYCLNGCARVEQPGCGRADLPLPSGACLDSLDGEGLDCVLDRQIRPFPVWQAAVEGIQRAVVPPDGASVCPHRHAVAVVTLLGHVGDSLSVMAKGQGLEGGTE